MLEESCLIQLRIKTSEVVNVHENPRIKTSEVVNVHENPISVNVEANNWQTSKEFYVCHSTFLSFYGADGYHIHMNLVVL